MNDLNAFEELDRRARIAAADVHTRASARPVPPFEPSVLPTVPRTVNGTAARSGRSPRPLLAVAAIVVLVVGAAVWVANRPDDDQGPADQVTTGTNRPFVAGDGLPDGFKVIGAAEIGSIAGATGLGEGYGPLDVYGPDLDDPRLGVTVTGEAAWVGEDTTRVPVGDRTGQFEAGGIAEGVDSLTIPVGSDAGGPSLVVFGRGLGRDGLVAIAEHTEVAGTKATVDAAALPKGWTLLGSSPYGVTDLTPMGALRGASAAKAAIAIYSRDSRGQEMITIQSEARPAGLDVSRLVQTDVEQIDVGGHEATVGRVTGPLVGDGVDAWVVRWEERPGELLTVSGVSLSRDQVLAVARGVQPVDPKAWKDLLHRTQLGELNDQAEGAVELGRGEFADGTPWILRLYPGDSGDGRTDSVDLSVALTGDSSSGSTGSSSETGSQIDENGNPVPTDPVTFPTILTMSKGGRVFIAGLVGTPGTTRVHLQGPAGVGSVDATVVTAEGRTGWVAELDRPFTEVVAYDSAGKELGRHGVPAVDGQGQVTYPDQPTTSVGG